jgi:hypothetical protein
VVLERLPERPELLVVAVGIDGDRVDERVKRGRGLVSRCHCFMVHQCELRANAVGCFGW